jgi:hypothetical protein
VIEISQTYIQLHGVVFVQGDVDHQKFITEFYEMLDSKRWFYQGRSNKLSKKEDVDENN